MILRGDDDEFLRSLAVAGNGEYVRAGGSFTASVVPALASQPARGAGGPFGKPDRPGRPERKDAVLNAMRGSPSTYLVGRSARADIVLEDPTVSRLHAELVKGGDGTWYLTDRGSTGGTYLRDEGNWVPVTQEFVRPGDRLMLGSFECGVDELLRRIPGGGEAASGPPGGEPGPGSPVRDDRPEGPVLRDPATGEILPAEER